MNTSKSRLYVDLDGTLIKSDLLLETLVALLKKNFLYVLLVPFWLLAGKANLKRQLAARTSIRVDLLPYNQEFLQFLRVEQASGRDIVLISASYQPLVKQVAEHIGIFSQAIGSSDTHNLKGPNKLAHILTMSEAGQFDYAGDNKADLAIWARAGGAVLVNAPETVQASARNLTTIVAEFGSTTRTAKALLKSLRPHQWLKNGLLFLPLLLSHQVANIDLIIATLLSFVAFSFCASSVYVLNDLLDLESDRQHERKKSRPFAAGDLPITTGLVLSPVLLFLAFCLGAVLPTNFLLILTLYYVITFLYSTVLKSIIIVDVLTLAGLYTIRIIAGAAVINVVPTFWLLAFSMFLFLSLAMVKRVTELLALHKQHNKDAKGRGYVADDLLQMSMMGSASGFMAVMVFALYINAEETRGLYATPEVLWFVCPLLLYMICRIWIIANRGKLHHDPVVFVLQDTKSQAVTIICALLFWLATLQW